LKNPNLRFRGSANQRVIRVQESLKEDKLVLWDDNEGLFEGK
jgi:anaerobic ribonucleoside-triphosphate reductase activating protein